MIVRSMIIGAVATPLLSWLGLSIGFSLALGEPFAQIAASAAWVGLSRGHFLTLAIGGAALGFGIGAPIRDRRRGA